MAAESFRSTRSLSVPARGGVALLIEAEKKYAYCNAVAISPHWMLTAAHCCIGQIYVVPSPDVLAKWNRRDDPSGLSNEVQKVALCAAMPGHHRPEDRGMDEADLALIRVDKPLPLYVVPARRLEQGVIVKKAPIIDLDKLTVGQVLRLAPSEATAEVSQYVSPDRFTAKSSDPMVARIGIVGFDGKGRAVILSPEANDLVKQGTSGSGIFVPGADGEPRLLGITTAVIAHLGDQAILALDVRPNAAWIDAEMAKP